MMRGQIFITDIIIVAVYYIIVVNLWFTSGGLRQILYDTVQNTNWSWIAPLLDIIFALGPLGWLLTKFLWSRTLI